jgi:hypothetical protein
MILPTKRLNQDRALLYVGSEVLSLLDEPKTVSRVWDELGKLRASKCETSVLTYDWFVLSLDLLFSIQAIDFERGLLRRQGP